MKNFLTHKSKNDAFIIFDYNKHSVLNTIIQNRRISIMKSYDRYILYSLKNKNKKMIILYDYVNNSRNVIYETDAEITCANFSPNGEK